MLFSRSHGLDNVHDLRADALLGLVGGSADVGRAGHHGMAVQRLVGGGLVGVHVQTGGAHLAGLQGGQQGGLVEQDGQVRPGKARGGLGNLGEGHVIGQGLGFGVDLAGKTLGIVGMGDIGSRVVKRALASDMRVIYHNRHRRSDDAALGAAYVSFEELLQTSDFELVTVPLTKETEGMFGKKQFEAMKQGARFINIARGKIVDTEALYDALSSGHIAYAALDVTDPEPLPGTHKLLTLDNITVTPHIASSTVETRDAMAKLAAENILAGLNGEPMPAEVKA